MREITRDHINQALPAQGTGRSLTAQALRSLFRVLKARRMVFTNPATQIRTGRSILLAAPVRGRLAAWLDQHAARWPNTANPYLLVNTKTAVRTGQVSHLWISQTLGLPAQAVREDRILHEAVATAGDVRRLCDLFGLSVKSALRYTANVHTWTWSKARPEPRRYGWVDSPAR